MQRKSIFFFLFLSLIFVIGVETAEASARSEYLHGVDLFKSLLVNEKKAGFRAEWQKVLKPFEKSLALQPQGAEAPKCMYFMGRVYEELGRRSFLKSDREQAFHWFDKMVGTYPNHGWADDCLYRKGLIWQEQIKDLEQARLAFEAVVRTYPQADMAVEARERLKKLGPSGGAGAVTPAQVSAPALNAQPGSTKAEESKSGVHLKSIRHWSGDAYTRIVMDLSQVGVYDCQLLKSESQGQAQLQAQLHNTIIGQEVTLVRNIEDGIVSQIQVAPDDSGGALVTLNLMHMDSYRVFTLPEPYRIVIDLYGARNNAPGSALSVAASSGEGDHVRAVLNELQSQKHVQGSHVAAVTPKSSAPSPGADVPKTTASAPAAPKAIAPAPKLEVSPTQKKFTGSLVEQLGLKVRTIMLDPGHGGKDPGAVANGIQEKNINLRLAKIMGKMLQDQGFEVHYTRTTDQFIPLEGRTAMANAKNADLFISVHCNSNPSSKLKGLEIYYLSLATDAQAVRVAARENGVSAKKISDMQFILSDLMINSKINESRQMATIVEQKTLQTVRSKYPLNSQGSRGAFFYVLTGARMPSILVEAGYLTNAQEAANLNSDAYLTILARGLVNGVVAYKDKLEQIAKQG